MPKLLKKGLTVVAVGIVSASALLAFGVWLIAHEKLARLRSIAAPAAPVPPLLSAAILAAEDPGFLDRPRDSLRAIARVMRAKTMQCGPSPVAYVLVRPMTPPRQTLYRKIDMLVTTYVVSRLYTPEELLRMYAHEIYLGTIDGRDVIGVEAASRAYFGKTSRELTRVEAATIAAMIRRSEAGRVKLRQRSQFR